jgi:CheY-like chemotaxis protein
MQQNSHASIMVIGADSHFCYLMRRYVKKSAHSIIFAYIGEDALALAQRELPSAIILEVDQPDSGGWFVLRALRTNRVTCSIPVVLCSWMNDEKRGFEEGARVYLRKPILYDDFLLALNQIGVTSCP